MQNAMIEEDRLVVMGEAARLLGVDVTTLRRWEKQGKIKSVRFSPTAKRRFHLRDIKKIMEGKND